MAIKTTIKETIFTDAIDYFESILSAIEQAKKSIDLEVYIFDNDPLSHQIIQALSSAAKKGIQVRLLVDGVGACSHFLSITSSLQTAGAQIKIFHPLPWHLEQWRLSLSDNKGLEKALHLITSINKRDHRKLLIIDQKRAWLGSINISQTHLPQELGGANWRDTAILIEGMDLEAVQVAFDACWFKWSKKQTVLHLPRTPFMFNFSRALRIKQRKRLLSRIEKANDRIWITNAYFIPDTRLMDALALASYRGVDVRILLPSRSDIFFIPWASQYFYSRLLKAGARIFEFQMGILHAKTILIDDWASIGSSNLNRRSLHHDLELDYSLQIEASRKHLSDDFLEDIKQSEELSLTKFKQTRLWQRIIGSILVVLLAHWV